MIKSNFQLEKEKERSILDCITSITGKLNEATVVGFSAPMGGIAGAQPSWATQRAKALTNPSLPLPLKPGQTTPFIARPPFVGQAQSSQQPQGSNQAQIATPSPDIVEPSPDEEYNQTMAGGNFSGASIADTAGMKERATERMGQAPSTTSMPSYLPQTQNTPTAEQRVRAAGEAQAAESAKKMAEKNAAEKIWNDSGGPARSGYNYDDLKTMERRRAETAAEDNNADIAEHQQSLRTQRNEREAKRLEIEQEAQQNRETERDVLRTRYSRPIYDKDSGTVRDSYTGKRIGYQNVNNTDGNMSSSRFGLGGGGGSGNGGGGGRIPESFNGSLNRLDEIAAGISAIAGTDLGKHIKDFAVDRTGEAIDFLKTQAPKVGYIALTPPRVLAAAATGRLSGLGYSKDGAIDTFNYYRNMIGGLGKAGGNLLTGLAGTAAGQKVGTAAGKVAGKVASWVGPIGIQAGKDVVGALDPEGHINAFADEAANLAGAALYDPRLLSFNIKSKPSPHQKD